MRIINFNDGFTSAAAPAVEMLASSVSVTPSTNLASTDAQAALTELANEIVPHIANLSNPHVVTKAQVGLSAVTNDAQVKRTEMGATSGVATLDSGGKVPTAQLPDAVVGSVKYQGTWNALTNTPTLVTSTGSKGDYYVVSSDGTTNLNGTTDWKIGDWAIFNGSGWQKIDNTDAIASVNGYTGVVVLAKDDVGLGNVDNTSDATKNAAAAVLTNKDHDGGTASNTSRLTVPKAALSTLTGLTRKQGTLVYDTTANALLADDGTNLNTIGSGSGEKNYIAAPSTASGWTASGAGITVATDSTAADLPRPNTSKTGILLTGVSGSTAYAYYRFILDDADAGKKLKVQFDMKPGTAVASDFKVDVYSNTASDYTTGNTRRVLSTDVSAVSALPALTGTYRTTFDAPAVSAKWIEVRIGLNAAATHTLVVSDVVVGPGVVTQGAALGSWTTYTMGITGSTSNPTKGTVAVDQAVWRRNGDCLEILYTYRQTGAGSAGSGTYRFALPSGFTINNAVLSGAGNTAHACGAAYADSGASSATARAGIVSSPTNTLNGTWLELWVGDETFDVGPVGSGVCDLSNASAQYALHALVPVNEYAGSGTINVVQNDVEYVSNSSSTDAADTSAFVYGPGGATGVMGTTALTAARAKRVRFLTPIQQTDTLALEVFDTTANAWFPITSHRGGSFSWVLQNTTGYGTLLSQVSATDVDVTFQQYARPTGASFAAAGEAWNAIAGTLTKWRVKKVSGGQAVGFSEVQPGVSSGLVSANGLKGRSDSTAAPTGYVGELLERNVTGAVSIPTSTNTDVDGTGITLTAGTWDLSGVIHFTPAATTSITALSAAYCTATGNVTTGRDLQRGYAAYGIAANVNGGQEISLTVPTMRVTVAAGTTQLYVLKAVGVFTVSTLTATANLRATRII